MKLRLTSSLLSALRRPISGEIVAKRLPLNCSATRQQRANRRRRLTSKDVSCVMVSTPEGISVKALKWSWWRRRQSNDTKTTKRRTVSLFTRVSCAMLSDTATSCRSPSYGERATREATTNEKEKRTPNSVASRCTRSCSTVPSSFVTSKTISSSDMSRCGARKKSQSSRLTDCVACGVEG